MPYLYYTTSTQSNLNVNLIKLNHKNACDIDENDVFAEENDGFIGEDDEIENEQMDSTDEKFSHDLGVILGLLREFGSKNNLAEKEKLCDKPGVINGCLTQFGSLD
ncbi:unnamed protein product [Amaranthus hypochondriacus]